MASPAWSRWTPMACLPAAEALGYSNLPLPVQVEPRRRHLRSRQPHPHPSGPTIRSLQHLALTGCTISKLRWLYPPPPITQTLLSLRRRHRRRSSPERPLSSPSRRPHKTASPAPSIYGPAACPRVSLRRSLLRPSQEPRRRY